MTQHWISNCERRWRGSPTSGPTTQEHVIDEPRWAQNWDDKTVRNKSHMVSGKTEFTENVPKLLCFPEFERASQVTWAAALTGSTRGAFCTIWNSLFFLLIIMMSTLNQLKWNKQTNIYILKNKTKQNGIELGWRLSSSWLSLKSPNKEKAVHSRQNDSLPLAETKLIWKPGNTGQGLSNQGNKTQVQLWVQPQKRIRATRTFFSKLNK